MSGRQTTITEWRLLSYASGFFQNGALLGAE